MTSETLFQLVLAVGAALALWNKQRRSAAKKTDPAKASAREDALEAERRRRVQEDIRKKIAQRAFRANQPPADLRNERRAQRDEPAESSAATEVLPPFVAGKNDPISVAPSRPAGSPSPIEASPFRRDLPPAPPAPPPDWLMELRDHAGVRRAILLREILSPPVGLR